jgi:bifunctional non-homologous end joining protein LigD
MLATLSDKPFDNPNWLFEIKWDGYRAIAELNGKEGNRLYSRNGLDFSVLYPVVFGELKKIKHKAVIDGEIVALDDKGMPGFQNLQQYGQNPQTVLQYYVFDILSLDGHNIEDQPLVERKELLRQLLPESDIIRYCDHVQEQGNAFFKAVQKQGLEGMIAKRADSTYHEGVRTDSWLKIKHVITDEAVIVGYTEPRGGRKYFGALVLGAYEKGKLVYIGHTGTGFTQKTLKDVYNQLQPLVTGKNPFGKKVPVNMPVTWVEPDLVCNLKFTEVTAGGNRRHPVFLGLREDKSAREVHGEKLPAEKPAPGKSTPATNAKAKAMDKEKTIGGKKVALSHTDKLYWPEDGYTKGDMLDYYESMYKYIIPYLKDRPLSLKRNPNGIHGEAFFHKDAGENAPEWMDTFPVWSESSHKTVDYLVCNSKPALLYVANLGSIEMNPWNSRTASPDNPDYLVMDIDPSDGNTFEQVIDTALVIKQVLDKAGVDCYCKTSGATGLHVYIPMGAKYDYEQGKSFAQIVAQMAQEQLPDFTTLERSLSKRGKDRLYIDYLQNRKGQTLACAYSLRPRIGAPVSTPLEWKEVKHGLDPLNFNMKNILKRVEKKGDLFLPVLKKGIDMAKALKKLSE